MPARFISRRHPGTTPFGLVVARAQVVAVGLTLGAAMVVTTAAVLQGVPVLRPFLILTPLAYAAAVGWTVYDLMRTPAEVLLSGSRGAVRSVWDVARTRERQTVRLDPIYQPRKGDGALLVGFGHSVVAFRPDEWPEFDDLRDALEAAADLREAEAQVNGA
jgi:hypothetical protein